MDISVSHYTGRNKKHYWLIHGEDCKPYKERIKELGGSWCNPIYMMTPWGISLSAARRVGPNDGEPKTKSEKKVKESYGDKWSDEDLDEFSPVKGWLVPKILYSSPKQLMTYIYCDDEPKFNDIEITEEKPEEGVFYYRKRLGGFIRLSEGT